MSTPEGKGNVTAYVDRAVEIEVERLAQESGLNRSKYVTAILLDAIQRRRVFRLKNGVFLEEKAQNQHSRAA